MNSYDLIVVGEGFAGLTCAAEAARLGLRVATFEARFFGGMVVNVNELEHFEEAQGLSGMDHAGLLASGNKKAGVKSVSETVRSVQAMDGGYAVQSDAGAHFATFIVLASGASVKKLDVPGEVEFEGRGVSHCADCDAPMFTNATVVVVGSGDWALKDAFLLARECSAVHVVYQELELGACVEYIARIESEPKIHRHAGQTIEEILGDDRGMTGIRMRDAAGVVREIPALGLFALSRLEPNSAFAPADVARDADGYLVVNDDLETASTGLWAIGQVRSGFGGWLEQAVSDARLVASQMGSRLN